MARDGTLLASLSGRVGRQLPRISPASEHVACLAAAFFPEVALVHSDYKNLDHLESMAAEVALHPRGMYSGIRRQIRGVSGPEYAIRHCQGHL